jgi:hypothetical protein
MLTCQLRVRSDLFAQVNLQGCSIYSLPYNCVTSTSAVALTSNAGTYFQRRRGTNPRSKCDSTIGFVCANPFPFIIAGLYQEDRVNDDTNTKYSYTDFDNSTCDDLSPIREYEIDPDFLGGTIFNWKDSPP